MTEEEKALTCPACGQEVTIADAQAKAEDDEASAFTCPTCGAGFDRSGNLTHEPAIGP
jgi:predicted RNA-binding Zn-ribbon protein involved in translation (DUF1610 family)